MTQTIYLHKPHIRIDNSKESKQVFAIRIFYQQSGRNADDNIEYMIISKMRNDDIVFEKGRNYDLTITPSSGQLLKYVMTVQYQHDNMFFVL